MSKLVFNLVDHHFAHSDYAVAGVESRLLRWDRGFDDAARPTFFTHEDMYHADLTGVPRRNRYGLLIESQAIIPRVYRRVESVMNEFELVFTHSSRLLRRFSNARWIPGGGIWIGGSYAGGDMGLHEKGRNVSMLTSSKLKTRLHRRRYLMAWRLERSGSPVDVFRQPLRSDLHVSANETVRDYRYSICLENYIDDAYFTEKLLNCMAAGTVPVYLGATRISDFFDPHGVIPFTGYRDLVNRVLPTLTPDDYASRRESIAANLAEAQRYRSIEDFIVRTYFGGAGT